MSRYIWEEHYRIINDDTEINIEPELFDISKITNSTYLADNCGKLMRLENVTLKDANGTNVFAPDDGSVALTANCANRAFTGINSNQLVLRTSTFADFANKVMPEGPLNITGIFTRYRNTWQILLRTIDDVEEGTTWSVDELEGSGHGTLDDPYNVARALALTKDSHNDPSAEVYITGIIQSITEVSPNYGNATYFISDPNTPNVVLQVFRGKYLDGEAFTSEDQIKVGDDLLILGKLKLWNNEPEVDTNNKIIRFN